MESQRKFVMGFRSDGSNTDSLDRYTSPKIPNQQDIAGGADSLDGQSLLSSSSLGCIPKLFQPFLQTHAPCKPIFTFPSALSVPSDLSTTLTPGFSPR